MLHLVIDLMTILGQTTRKGFECPDRQALWIDLAGHVARNLARLGISAQLLNKLGLGRAKQSLNNGPSTRLMGGAFHFRDKALSK